MRLHLSAPPNHLLSADIQITGSKSESNRLLLLKALYPNLTIENLSNSDDSNYMKNGLQLRRGTVDIHHAGTAMRFLTAFFASQEGVEVTLTGSARMKERPISILVDALKTLGADIEYLEIEGYPPLAIKGRAIHKSTISLPADISSQYISALLLIGSKLSSGIELNLQGEITSVPYIKMTCALLTELGIENSFEGNKIKVEYQDSIVSKTVVVESDWSSASYFYSIVALSPVGSEIRLTAYKERSLQGDSVLRDIYSAFGISTGFKDYTLILKKEHDELPKEFSYNLVNAPDLAQTIAVTCFGLGIPCSLTGLHTLKIKETDRLEALHKELTKLGAEVSVTAESLDLQGGTQPKSDITIQTYHDHRMAMAFAPLALLTGIFIDEAEVVSKSYPDFWNDLRTLGISISKS